METYFDIPRHRQLTLDISLGGVDHINGIKIDNRRVNLRVCTYAQNVHKGVLSGRNTSGVKGVYWSSRRNRWRVQITVDMERLTIGSFAAFHDAVAARKDAEAKYWVDDHGQSQK